MSLDFHYFISDKTYWIQWIEAGRKMKEEEEGDDKQWIDSMWPKVQVECPEVLALWYFAQRKIIGLWASCQRGQCWINKRGNDCFGGTQGHIDLHNPERSAVTISQEADTLTEFYTNVMFKRTCGCYDKYSQTPCVEVIKDWNIYKFCSPMMGTLFL